MEPQEDFKVSVNPPLDKHNPNPRAANTAYSEFPLYFPNSRKGVLQVPAFASKQDYAVLKKQMDHIMELMKTISGLWGDEELPAENQKES